MKNGVEKISKILNTPEEIIRSLEEGMNKITGKHGVIDLIAQDIDDKVKDRLKRLGLDEKTDAKDIFNALQKETKRINDALFDHFHKPDLTTQGGCRTLVNAVKELTGDMVGFYLKEEAAKNLFRKNPPKKIMASLGYGDDVEKMIQNEDIFEIFAALRFVEEKDWLNKVFFKAYDVLTKDDFESRPIKVMVLPERWIAIAEKFMGKKLHHMSHLKELGLIFIIPTRNLGPQETLYLFFMTLHYSYEVDWHSRLFATYANGKDFIEKMTCALKVETSGMPLPIGDKVSWRLVLGYLAKQDKNDPRLYEPHINPESLFFTKASGAIDKFASRFLDLGLDFWYGSDILASLFTSGSKKELVSFDLFDNGISLLSESSFEDRQVYHQQEALWNKIFTTYITRDKMEEMMIENLTNGYVAI